MATKTKTHKLEKELLKALGAAARKSLAKLKGNAYRVALVTQASELADDAWEELGEAAQEWCNAGVKALKAKKPVADFDGKVPKGAKATAAPAKDKGAKGAKKSSKKTPAAKPAKGKRTEGVTTAFQKLVVANMGMKTAELLAKFEKGGKTINPTTAGLVVYQTRKVVKLLQERKLLKKNLI